MRRIWDEENKLQKFFDVEVVFVRVYVKVGNILEESVCVIFERVNMKWVKFERVKEIEVEIYYDIMVVVKVLSEVCGEYGKYVYFGVILNDIIDIVNVFFIKESFVIVERDLKEFCFVFKCFVMEYKYIVCIGRIYGQYVVFIIYGMKFVIWLDEVQRYIDRINQFKERVFVGQMSGVVGIMVSFGERGFEIQRLVMEGFGFKFVRIINQIIQRDVYVEFMMVFVLIVLIFDKIVLEIRNFQWMEIFEVSEFFGKKQVGLLIMLYKRNLIRSEKVSGLVRVFYLNVIFVLLNNFFWYERDFMNFFVECVIFLESFVFFDEMLKIMIKVFLGFEFFFENIKRNFYFINNFIMVELLMLKLMEKGMGRQEVYEFVRQLVMKVFYEKRDFFEVVRESEEVMKYFIEEDFEFFKLENYIGFVLQIVDNVIVFIGEKEREEVFMGC